MGQNANIHGVFNVQTVSDLVNLVEVFGAPPPDSDQTVNRLATALNAGLGEVLGEGAFEMYLRPSDSTPGGDIEIHLYTDWYSSRFTDLLKQAARYSDFILTFTDDETSGSDGAAWQAVGSGGHYTERDGTVCYKPVVEVGAPVQVLTIIDVDGDEHRSAHITEHSVRQYLSRFVADRCGQDIPATGDRADAYFTMSTAHYSVQQVMLMGG